jgi:hypothetical protein
VPAATARPRRDRTPQADHQQRHRHEIEPRPAQRTDGERERDQRPGRAAPAEHAGLALDDQHRGEHQHPEEQFRPAGGDRCQGQRWVLEGEVPVGQIAVAETAGVLGVQAQIAQRVVRGHPHQGP